MKIKPEFVDLIKNSKKTIELRKTSALKLYATDFSEKGRITIDLINKEYKEYGKLIINGYQIIPNFFNFKIEELKPSISLIKGQYYPELNENKKWIKKYWDWLKDYFKYEDEIVIFNIEKFEEKIKNGK